MTFLFSDQYLYQTLVYENNVYNHISNKPSIAESESFEVSNLFSALPAPEFNSCLLVCLNFSCMLIQLSY